MGEGLFEEEKILYNGRKEGERKGILWHRLMGIMLRYWKIY